MNYSALVKCNQHSNPQNQITKNENPIFLSKTSTTNRSVFSCVSNQLLSLILFTAGVLGGYTLDSATAQAPIHIEWDQHNQAVLTKDPSGQGLYNDRTATVSFSLSGDAYEYSFSVAETKNSQSISNTDTPVEKEAISGEKFLGTEFAFEQDLDYGSWYISSLHRDSDRMYLLFRPNSTAINALTQTDSVTSNLTIKMHEMVNGESREVARNSLTLTIKGESFTIQSHWNSGFDGILKVNKANQHYNDISTILYYNHGSYEIEFTSVSEATYSGNQESTVTSTTTLPASINIGQYDSTNLQQFGDNLNYGSWYIVNSYECDGYYQCKLLIFRPNVAAINALNGTDIIEAMEITYTDSDQYSEVYSLHFRIESPDTEVAISNPSCTNNEAICTSSSIEGEELEIEVTRSNHNVSAPLIVDLEISETGNMLVEEGIRTIIIEANSLSKTITFETIQDSIHEHDSEVTVTLLYSGEYTVNESQKAYTNIVNDNDIAIQLSRMEAEIIEITEGEVAEFTIVSTTGPALEDIQIDFTLIEEGPDTNNTNYVGGYAVGELPSKVILAKGQEETSITISTLDDSDFRGNGRIKLQLTANPSRYVLDNSASYSTNIVDIRENEPSFAVSALSDAVVEGDNLTFTIAIDGAVQNSQMVSIEFSGDTSFIAGELTREVEFLPTTRAKPLFIATNDNTIHNEFGIITATIVADSSYGTNDASVSVQILDDETPTISLASELTESYEGYSVDFEISADRNFALDLNVQVEFSPAELVVGPAVRTISLLASDPDLTQTFNIQLVNDQIHNKRRTLTAKLLDGGNYNINEEISNQVSVAHFRR